MTILNAYESQQWLTTKFPIAKSILAHTRQEVIHACNTLGYPTFLKLLTEGHTHKTDIHGVVQVNSEEQALQTINNFLATAKKLKTTYQGILVQERVEGRELLIGITRDPTFGPIIACGIGGIYAEALHDITFRACPITTTEARSMLDSLRTKEILGNYRNQHAINTRAVAQIIHDLSEIAFKTPTLQQLDINPLIVNEKEAKIADARVIITP